MGFPMETKTNTQVYTCLDNSVYSPSDEGAPPNVGKFHVQNTMAKDLSLERINLNSKNANVFNAVTQLKEHLIDDEDDDPADNEDVMDALQTILDASSGKLTIDILTQKPKLDDKNNKGIYAYISRNEKQIERGYIRTGCFVESN